MKYVPRELKIYIVWECKRNETTLVVNVVGGAIIMYNVI
jgi:hypothetical protein